MATVLKVDPDEPTDVVIRKFNRLVSLDLVLTKSREKQYYTKPSRQRYLKKKELKRGGRRKG